MREDLIFGIHVIERFIKTKPDQLLEIYVSDIRTDQRIMAIQEIAKSEGIAINKVPKKKLDEWLPELNHQGIAARVKHQARLTENDLSELIEHTKTSPLFLVLDGVQDPHNLGACLRTADAAGVTALIIPKDRSATLTPVVRKVASGAAETVPVIPVTNLVRCLEDLKKQGVWIMGASLENTSQSLFQVNLQGSLAIVLGSEGTGLRRLTKEHCDILMHIPMQGTVESLNVSVAAGICLYEVLRQRNFKVN